MAGFSGFGVDLDLLEETVAEMTHCGAALDGLLDEVARRVATLHGTWAGAAAVAQMEAQTEWAAGFRQMCEALAAMRAAGRVAHESYRDAVATNVRMWEQVS
jgi:WXG100 family type VII secretion target